MGTIEIAEQGEEDRNRSSHGVKVGTGFGREGKGRSSFEPGPGPECLRGLGHARFAAMEGRELLVEGPKLNLWRAATDNDGSAFM